MAGGFTTSPEQLTTAANHVGNVADQVQGQLNSLGNQLAPLAGAWRGTASTAFQNLMTRYNENSNRLNQALRGIGEQLAGAGTTYAQTEEQETSSMTNITNALG